MVVEPECVSGPTPIQPFRTLKWGVACQQTRVHCLYWQPVRDAHLQMQSYGYVGTLVSCNMCNGCPRILKL